MEIDAAIKTLLQLIDNDRLETNDKITRLLIDSERRIEGVRSVLKSMGYDSGNTLPRKTRDTVRDFARQRGGVWKSSELLAYVEKSHISKGQRYEIGSLRGKVSKALNGLQARKELICYQINGSKKLAYWGLPEYFEKNGVITETHWNGLVVRGDLPDSVDTMNYPTS